MSEKILKKLKRILSEDTKLYRCYQISQWKRVRELALSRDRFECQDCKDKGLYSRAEDVHHILELKERPDLFLDTNNIVSLCKDCHNKRHKRFQYTEKEFENEEKW